MSIPDRAKRVWRNHFGNAQKGVDDTGCAIALTDYGNEVSPFGWYLDHIKPISQGGSDDYSNLRPLNVRSSRSKNHIDNFLLVDRNYEYFKEGIRFTVLFASISVFVTSLFGWISFLIMALGEMPPLALGSWIGFAISFVFFLLAICLGLKYLPKSIKFWWRRSRIGRTINRFGSLIKPI